MLSNKEIADQFKLLGSIMELHGENAFKIRSYQNAYRNLRTLEQPLAQMPEKEIASLKGIGKAITGKIKELLETGTMSTLERYKAETPEGVREMLNIKGFGPKKIMVVWKDLGVESIGELLYAVNENRLIELKGFGEKTQEDLRKKLEYYQKSKNLFHFATLEKEALALLALLQKQFPNDKTSLTGAVRRATNTVKSIDILTTVNQERLLEFLENKNFQINVREVELLQGITAGELPFAIYFCQIENFGSKLFRYTASEDFLQAFMDEFKGQDFKNIKEEAAVFSKVNLPFIEPELREQDWALNLAKSGNMPSLISSEDIKGVLHTHTTYSDGIHSLTEMATYSKELGYSYIGITDHSQSAFYANGLKEDRVLKQFEEIDQLNQKLAPFRIFKGIESDILNDGRLDYEEALLKQFDFIVASVHSNLRMDEQKATQRIVTALENPYTTILGHPTGRLLLSREGYPLDHKRIIDACAANNVAIELNANPYRLDLDWTWIPYALEKGVKIAINPDAHSKEGIHHIHYGVKSARKGGLSAENCLNTMEADAFAAFLVS